MVLLITFLANLKKHHQEKEEEKLKESLHYKRSLIERHHRKNWACYTMLLCEIYGILRRRCTINGWYIILKFLCYPSYNYPFFRQNLQYHVFL